MCDKWDGRYWVKVLQIGFKLVTKEADLLAGEHWLSPQVLKAQTNPGASPGGG